MKTSQPTLLKNETSGYPTHPLGQHTGKWGHPGAASPHLICQLLTDALWSPAKPIPSWPFSWVNKFCSSPLIFGVAHSNGYMTKYQPTLEISNLGICCFPKLSGSLRFWYHLLLRIYTGRLDTYLLLTLQQHNIMKCDGVSKEPSFSFSLECQKHSSLYHRSGLTLGLSLSPAATTHIDSWTWDRGLSWETIVLEKRIGEES